MPNGHGQGGPERSGGSDDKEKGPSRRNLLPRNPLFILALVLGVVFLINLLWGNGQAVEISYATFKGYLLAQKDLNPEVRSEPEPGQPRPAGPLEMLDPESDASPGIYDVVIQPGQIRGKLRPDPDSTRGLPEDWDRHLLKNDSKWEGFLPFSTEYLGGDQELRQLLESRGVEHKDNTPTDWTSGLLWALPLVFFVFILLMMFRSSRMSGENVLSFGRSRAKVVGEDKTGVTFSDVAGADEAKEELAEIVEFLKEPERFTSLGGKIPKGCLLMGAPGCGKTLLARAVAGEAQVPFFSISGSDFVEMFVGVGAARVRDLFNTAKQKAPCIVFVDEIDAVGRHRGTGLGGGHDEREQTLNQLLVEMDGFDGRKGVIVIAATNRPDILDPALLRPGRFDRQVVLDAPDFKGREAVLKIHARGKPLASDVNLSFVAKRTPGFSGADLANVMNEAALLAARRRRQDIGRKELEEAVERVVAGPERRSRIISEGEKKILAYHELGHALVARFSEHADPVHKVSIIPRGKGALGYTLTLPEEDRYIITKAELLARIRVTMGGRSAEEIVFDHQSTGAEDDLQKATQLARALVCRWGMTDALGPITYERSPGNPFLGRDMSNPETFSDETAGEIDRAIRDIVESCHEDALAIITENRTLLEKLADHLMAHEILDLEEFENAVQTFAETAPPPLRAGLLSENSEPTPPPAPGEPGGPPPPPVEPDPPPVGSAPLPQGT